MTEDQEWPQPPTQAGPLKRWMKVGYLLLGLSMPALLEIFFEVVILTLSSGPQMLFYSIIHTVGAPLGVVLGLSLLANPAYAIFALGLLVYRGAGKLAEPGLHFRILIGGFVFQTAVFFLLFTYDYWAYALFN